MMKQGGWPSRVVLAYSGGLETSAAISWCLAQGAAVVTVSLDLGQGRPLEELRLRALNLGAARAHALDVREEFARDCILPALQDAEAHDPLAPIARIAYPLIARKLVEIAAIEQAPAVVHGGSADDHAALEAAVRACNPKLQVIAFTLASGMTRDAMTEFVRSHGGSVPAGTSAEYEVAGTLWGRAVTRAAGEWSAPPETLFALTRAASRTPDMPAHVEVEFDEGVPVAINGVPMPLTELIESVTTIAGNHGVGRATRSDHRTVYEAPAAVILSEAHDALTGGLRGRANGVVRMKLFKGEHTIVGHSPVAVAGVMHSIP
jgi:argininosuccinate synthase